MNRISKKEVSDTVSAKDYVLKYKSRILVLIVFILLQTLFTFTIPVIVRILLEGIKLKNISNNYFLLFIFAMIGTYLSNITYILFLLKFSLLFKYNEVKRVFYNLFQVKLPFIQGLGPTYFSNRILVAGNTLFALIGNALANALVASISIIASLIFVFLINKLLFLMFIFLIPLSYFSYRRLNAALQEKSKKLQKISACNIKNIINVTQGIEDIKQLSNYNAFSTLIGKYIYNLEKANNDVSRYAQVLSSTIQFFIDLIKNGVLFLTIYYLLIGKLVFADMIFVNLIFSIYFNAIGSLNSINISRRDVKASLDFIGKEIMTQQEMDDGKESLSCIEKITFAIKDFSYTAEKTILKKVNFEIKRGENAAIVGVAGSGKTTLVKLLTRYYDNGDGILVNDKPLSNYTLDSIRKKIYAVSQSSHIFPGNIRDNLIIGLEKVEQKRFDEVINLPFFSNFLRDIPYGLETELGEGGVNVSGGQKQKILIARLLMHDPEVIVFDESTSSLDSQSEDDIYETIKQFIKDKIVIKISHRLSTIKKAKMIIVLKNGEIENIGTYESLLSKSKEYKDLFSSQLV